MTTIKSVDKIRLFALLEPLNIRISLCFPGDSLVADIHNFIDDVMRKYTIKYRVGRVEWNGAWILPQYKIADFLDDKAEVTVYSVEYGLTLRTLSQERDRLHVNYSIFDQNSINGKFIAKKTIRENKNKKRIHTINGTQLNDENDDTNHPNLGTVESDDNVIHFENTNVKTNVSAPVKKETNPNPNAKQQHHNPNQNKQHQVDKNRDNNQMKKNPPQQQHQPQSDKKKQQPKPQKNFSGDESNKYSLKLGEDNRKGHKKQHESYSDNENENNEQQEDLDDFMPSKKQKTK